MGNGCPKQPSPPKPPPGPTAKEMEAERQRQAAKARAEAELRERLAKENKARDKYNLAKNIWNQAWAKEQSGDADNATKQFNQALALMREAFTLDPSNSSYKVFRNTIEYKLAGNKAFNDGLVLHEKANQMRDAGNYVGAARMYALALEKFNLGAQSQPSDALYFHGAIDIVKESLDTVQKATEQLTAQERAQVFEGLRRIVNEKAGREVVNENSSIQVVYQYIKDGHF